MHQKNTEIAKRQLSRRLFGLRRLLQDTETAVIYNNNSIHQGSNVGNEEM